MDDKMIEKVAEATAKATVDALKEHEVTRCNFCKNEQAIVNHMEHHRFLEDLMGFLDRLNAIRWGILKNILQAGALALLALVCTLLWRHFRG